MRLLLVDDHPLFLDGLASLLKARGLEVAGVAHDGLEALAQVRVLRPDVVLMDIRMPRCNGLDATRLIKAEHPEVRVIILTMSDIDQDLFEAVRIGASGYLLKTQDTTAVLQGLNELADGQVALAPGLASRILAEFSRIGAGRTGDAATQGAGGDVKDSLSHRQVQVHTLVSQGLPYKEVGRELGLTERTVKYHMGEIIALLHLHNRAEAVAFARAHGITGGG
jgi:two-component system NarL family response regulator